MFCPVNAPMLSANFLFLQPNAVLGIQVGAKVAAVSRKTNTTTHEVLGVITKANTQIVSYTHF